MPFRSLHIIEPILKALEHEGYITPTPIQSQAIPIVLEGRDLLGVAQTGTGKTAAFAIPIIQTLCTHKPHGRKRIRSLILTPTRELAVQIDESFKAYGRHSGLVSTVIFGGVSQGKQTQMLQKGVDIVVATPGRLLDLMEQRYISLEHIEIFVLDEADRMLDMGFVHDVKRILTYLPKKRQSLFFSATMPPSIVSLASAILRDPVRVEVTPQSTTVERIEQSLYHIQKADKSQLLLQLLDTKQIKSALVFTRTKRGADVVARVLGQHHISAEAIHGNKAQNARQRALDNFKSRKTRVLVATDIAARGIDVDELEYVINYEIPNVPETYVHRIGRTGRAGATGNAISFCSPDEKPFLKDIEKLIGMRIPVAHDVSLPKVERTSVARPDTRRTPSANNSQQSNAPLPILTKRSDLHRAQSSTSQSHKPKPESHDRQENHSQTKSQSGNKKKSWFGSKKKRSSR